MSETRVTVNRDRIADLLADAEVVDEGTFKGSKIQDFIVSYRLKLGDCDFYVNGYSRDFIEDFDIETARDRALESVEDKLLELEKYVAVLLEAGRIQELKANS